jgi:hypothetical protein
MLSCELIIVRYRHLVINWIEVCRFFLSFYANSFIKKYAFSFLLLITQSINHIFLPRQYNSNSFPVQDLSQWQLNVVAQNNRNGASLILTGLTFGLRLFADVFTTRTQVFFINKWFHLKSKTTGIIFTIEINLVTNWEKL